MKWNDNLDDSVRRAAYHVHDSMSDSTVEDWEDMCQEGRLACWRWIRVNPGKALGPGLARILTIQAARDYERATRRHRNGKELPPGMTTDPWSEESCPSSMVGQPTQDYETVLGDILSKIVNDEREALVAMYVVYEGLTVREAAETMGVSKSQVDRIMTRLRDRAADLGVTA